MNRLHQCGFFVFGYRPRYRSLSQNPVHSMYDNLCASINRDNRTFPVPVEYKSQKLLPRTLGRQVLGRARACDRWIIVPKGLGKSINSQLTTCGSYGGDCGGHRGGVRRGVGSRESGKTVLRLAEWIMGGSASRPRSPHRRQQKTQQNLLRSTKPNIKIQFRQWSY